VHLRGAKILCRGRGCAASKVGGDASGLTIEANREKAIEVTIWVPDVWYMRAVISDCKHELQEHLPMQLDRAISILRVQFLPGTASRRMTSNLLGSRGKEFRGSSLPLIHSPRSAGILEEGPALSWLQLDCMSGYLRRGQFGPWLLEEPRRSMETGA
jgi:hypothetical protein